MFDASSALGRSAPLAQDRPSQPTLGDREPGKSVKPKLLLVNKSKAGTSKGRVGAQHEPPSWPASVAENDSRSGGRKAATRLPGRFDNDDTSSPLNADSPANIFVLKGMQPPSKHAEPPMPSATPPARQPVPPASGVGDLGRTDRLLLQRRSSDLFRAGQRHKTQHPERDSDEGSVHKLDVYGIDGEQAGIGAISAADGFLRSGSKVFIRDGESSHRKSLDFQGLKMMQVIDPSLLGRVLLQQVQPFQLTGRKGITQETVLVQDERPSLSLVNRHSVLSADAHLDNKANDVDEAIDSLMYLPSCNDAAILDCLQHRFHRGLYFTSCDNMLIFVNPWESHESAVGEVFNRRKAVQYWTAHIAELPSHPYLVARRAFTNAMKQHRNQLVLTFGTFGAGQDRVHHELVKLFIRFALTMEDTWTDEEARAAEIERDAAVSLLESLHITHRGELFGGRLVDLFQVELDAEGGVVGFSFLPNSSYEPSQDIVSWQMRQSLKSVPLPNLFYHVMYGIHYNVGDPVLEVAGLHPADVTALMHYFPLPFNTYEDAQYEKCQQFLSDLSTIGLSDRQKEEFLQILSAILVADVASYKIHNELPEEGQQAAEQESDVPASSAPRVRRIMKQKERTVEHAFVVGSKSAMTLAGLDIINLLANLLGIDETVLRDIFNGPDFWQVRFLALKLFVRLRWWLLGIIGQSLRLSKSTEVHNRITLLKAAGLDFRHTGPDWAFNQLLHNYTEECFLHLFASWAFTLDQATYLLEDVEPPPANFHMNDEILDVFTGPDGIWHILKHEHTTRGGEAADDLSDGVPLAAVSFVDKILKSKSCTNKIRQVPGYKPPKPETLKPKMAVRVVKATAKAATVRASSLRRKASDFDDSLCRFTVVHTSGTLVYDASKFCTSDANAYTVAPRLRTLLLQSKLELLRTLVQHETAHDVIPTDCLRISVTNRLIHYVKDSLSEGEASLIAHAALPRLVGFLHTNAHHRRHRVLVGALRGASRR
ncbi:IQ calmodulin-binding motif domain-containing protein, putative [Eimeria tenella]|uniref:IQ calmodulin-binding motif domain-containing protein, putative n=1 Tax=Eimeria tenella TaxID=5802 RepID=U6KKM6_EIMTE|nr:IQ calmodulin-binding motif domain-containing protein, putative [Eimeria tenella]CDJ37341.1 IQ calmodulin-binding motif domain-containing protein, putative [Eimeria tenella]|eukprot:XP_013228179.1 IQ calmodulin-binding motif domain-containing protein, putative [Eimeria tenella]